MRLFLCVVATSLLVIQQFTPTIGFSIPPTTSPPKRTEFTSLAFSAPAEIDETYRTLSSEGSNWNDDLQTILSTLEKRLNDGPGSLSQMEVEAINTGSYRILMEMKQKEAEQAAAVAAAANVQPPPDPVAEWDLRNAVTQMDATTVSNLLESGLEMDESMTDAAFWAVVQAVDRAEELDQPLSTDVPRMLHHIFDADLRHLLGREKITKNITCMQPKEEGLSKAGMSYIFDDLAHKDLPLKEGRRCAGGNCCDACSRNIFPTFAMDVETSLETFPELASLTFNELETVSAATIIQFARLLERVRRTIAHEYGLPLSTILPLQAYSRKYVAGTTQQGGGGGEGDFVTLHTDESTHDGYHYSCVLYLSTQGQDFEGGDFVFNDPAPKTSDGSASTDDYEEEEEEYLDYQSLAEQIRRAGRKLTPFHPTRGAAVIFSSGWENMHEVEKITSGVRYCVPCFFTTCPVPEGHYELMVQGKPQTDEDIAEDWLHLLLAHRRETPQQSAGRVKELLMKWHHMCTPLSEH
uniref:Fe2OG dioxygenase domain-containing protein n=1 Tax=Trieres chinensis TaxID=1514140 RepID=A0A7S2EIC4_TRICV|mmetsp:Transcript_2528/g.5420  ORF Transcript_2528/g.5420 Transcript_2528/m.5420 type:complete len:522 (+) Transcript_2528:110-1675(+)|eukprot:CAMPEP_0183302148 /NCGR_PEP_ID=MMETSP0160_2-20130417/8034_1 /TAXON_ID=2839 ORGANISM="Odontella Sinensis, Strain Grunow 1884" /NCGR_SAMPLE_ID=MMETSP0160_2 /ASSEMBLY_ACC=CAM_ASM_000250 /LENGTH=521 /DNA_ID=CAMNT_0025464881 /DNA_START=86 /DNA_END=1651 /DNA_ORIENTATION=-